MTNSKSRAAVVVFDDWFFNRFILAAEKYCKEKGIPFKILLILHNAPGHPQNVVWFCPPPRVTVIYLPLDTTSLLQLIDQRVIATVKRYYMKRTAQQAPSAADLEESITFHDIWREIRHLQGFAEHSSGIVWCAEPGYEWCMEETFPAICEWF